ncbi:MAG TPA: lipocalin-like domain-containing protein [Candidatus Baltobacteraceae bacterium]|jgi:hypothetical protein|nr:lipocalin-like domain-containing protein [Candidatus Baltobacteraceae bacterium]
MGLRTQLLGSWRLTSGEWIEESGPVDSPLGTHPVGLLIYDEPETVSVQIMRPNQAPFANDDYRLATDAEKAAVWGGYFCYFGTFSVDEANGTVTHRVTGSWFPNYVGTEQVRFCKLDGDRLTLTAKTSGGHVTVTWQRVSRDR